MDSQMVLKNEHNNDKNILHEQLNEIIKTIDSSKSKKIILVGSRSSGKTTLINQYRVIHFLRNDLVVLPNFNNLSSLIMTEEEKREEIGLILCDEILKFFEDNNLKKFYKEIIDNHKINLYNRCASREYLICFEKSSDYKMLLRTLLEIINKKYGYKQILLAVDKFDWIKNSSPIYQKIIAEFSSFFDKSIFVSEDETILCGERKEEIINNGYDIVNINYNRSIDILKKIIRIKLNSDKVFSINLQELLKDCNVGYLIDLSEGNLDIIFSVIDRINKLTEHLEEKEIRKIIFSTIMDKKEISSIIRKKRLQL